MRLFNDFEVKTAMLAARARGKRFFAVEQCADCKKPHGFVIVGSALKWDSSCDCATENNDLEQRDWSEPAEYMNKATDERRAEMAKEFEVPV